MGRKEHARRPLPDGDGALRRIPRQILPHAGGQYGHRPDSVRQRHPDAAVPPRRRERREQTRPRRQDGPAAHLYRDLPLLAPRFQGGRDDALRHPRQPRIHPVEAGRAVELRLAGRAGRRDAALLSLHHQQRRRSTDRQAPQLRHDGQPPDRPLHAGGRLRRAHPASRKAGEL